MAENRRKRNSFTKSLAANQKIDERFRNLMHDTFDGLYRAMGKKNFLRWIDTRKMSDRIKELVVEEFTKEDLDKHPNAAGFYTHGTNREKLREGYIDQNTATHETLHFFTDDCFMGKLFPTFINEGLTEYLNREFEKINTGNNNVGYSYRENVDFIEFLHNIMGDSLIKAYLTGTSKSFSEEFSTYITEDGKINTKALDKFYHSLNKIHNVLHPRKNPKTAKEQEKSEADKRDVIENHYPEMRKTVGYIVVNSIRKKAHDLEYYDNGEFDIYAAIDDINELTKKTMKLLGKHELFGLSSNNPSQENIELHESILKNALTVVLEESHVPNEKIEDIVNNSIRFNGNAKSTIPPRITESKLLGLINDLDIQDPAKDLIDKRLGNKESYMNNGQFNITSFLMDASLVLDKMNVKKDLRQVYLDSIILRYLPPDVNRDLVKTMIDKHSNLYVALYQKQQDNKRNVVDSKFIKISDTKFIEKRDNKIFFLDYDEKAGAFSETKMTNEYTYPMMEFSMIDRKTQGPSMYYRAIFNEDFSTVTVNGKECEILASPEKLGDRLLIDEALKPVLDGIKNNRYVTILNDGEEPDKDAQYTWINPDTRSRVINYSLFLADLKNTISSIPKEFQKDIEKTIISRLISRTYLMKTESMEELQNYIGSTLSLENITDEDVVSKLYSFTEKLNQSRRNYVEQQSRYNGVCFSSEDAKKRWTESFESKEKRKKAREFIQDVNAFVMIDSMACITDTLEKKTNEEHYSTMEGVMYPGMQRAKYSTAVAGKVDYEAFCDKLKDALSRVDESKRADFVSRVVNKSTDMWYGVGTGYPGANIIQNERFDLTGELEEILTDIINANTKVDMTRVSEIEKRLLELSKEEETICQRILETRKPTSFENIDVEKDYEAIKAIHEMAAIPEESKKTIIQELKSKSKSALDTKRKMAAFAKIALSGENVPSAEDVNKASGLIDFYKGIDRD